MAEASPLEGLLRRVARRLRLQRALEATSSMLILSGAWLLVAALLLKLERWPINHLLLIVAIALAWPLAAVVVALLRPVHPLIAAQIIDRRLQNKDRFGSAWCFAQQEADDVSPYAAAEMAEARQQASQVKVHQALPLRWPRRLGVFPTQLLGALILLVVPALPQPQPTAVAPPPPTVKGMAVNFDDLEGFNRYLRDVHQEAVNQELDQVAEAAEEFNRLLQDLADQRVPYRQALERIAALEQKLHPHLLPQDQEAEDYLKEVGEELAKASLTKPAGQALQEPELAKARDHLQKAAQQVKREPPDAERLEELRRALAEAAKRQPPDAEKQLRRLQQKQRRLKKKSGDTKKQGQNKRRLKKNKRELERLRRNLAQRQQGQRQLQRLQRDLQRLAESLNLQGNDELDQLLEQLSEDINRMARQQSTQEQMRSLQQRLEELRRLLQQMKRGGKSFKKRLGRFSKRAQGKGGKAGKGTGRLQPGRGGQQGLVLLQKQTSGGQKGSSPNPQSNSGGEAGQGSDQSGPGEPTKLKADYTDVEVQAQQGEGPSKSQVIDTAADQGFASERYRRVHQTYHRHAESVLQKQDIPSGYRQYIRQYFERIRPR
jgi:hypothetical protein